MRAARVDAAGVRLLFDRLKIAGYSSRLELSRNLSIVTLTKYRYTYCTGCIVTLYRSDTIMLDREISPLNNYVQLIFEIIIFILLIMFSYKFGPKSCMDRWPRLVALTALFKGLSHLLQCAAVKALRSGRSL